MWDFLTSEFKLLPHKNSTIKWNNSNINSNSTNNAYITVQYDSIHKQTSSGFRVEQYLKPNTSYQLEIEAKLIIGDFAFVYVEYNNERLVPRFKIYQNSVPYKLIHNFTTPTNLSPNIPTYLGILFFNSDKNYLLDVYLFKLQLISKLTESNLSPLKQNIPFEHFEPSVVSSILPSINTTPINIHPMTTNNMTTNNVAATQLTSLIPVKFNPFESSIKSTISKYTSNKDIYDIKSNNTYDIKSNNTYEIKSNDTYEIKSSFDWDNSTSYTRGATNVLRKQQMDKSDLNKLITFSETTSDNNQQITLPGKTDVEWFPNNITDLLINDIKDKLSARSTKIFISLTTTPQRLNKLDSIINSLLKQSIPITNIYVVIPNRFKRIDRPYLINKKWYFNTNPKIKIIRTPDVGPMSKLHPVLPEISNKDILLTVDDDHIYPIHWALFLTYLPIMYPNFKGVYGYKGFLNQKIVLSKKQSIPLNVDWLSGDLGVAYPRKFIRNPSKLLKQVGFSKEAYYSDDILIANHLAQSRVSRIIVPQVDSDISHLVYPKPTSWSDSRDSLHNMNPPLSLRYPLVLDILKKRKYYFLDNVCKPIKKDLIDPSDESESDDPIDKLLNNSNSSYISNTSNTTSNKITKIIHNKLDASIFDNKKIRYISYLTQIHHPEWILLYLKKISPNATLEMPNIKNTISLPNDYAPWLDKDTNNFDIIIIDLPFCLETKFNIKTTKPIFYIYRYPLIGSPAMILSNDKQSNNKPLNNKQLVINTNYHYSNLPEMVNVWRVLPELQIKSVGSTWPKNIKNLVLIVTDGFYVENLDNLIDFWRIHCQTLPIKLHLGLVSPLNEKLQLIINEHQIKNINIYTQSNIFGALIYKCDYYFSFGFHLDLYAIWAYQNKKPLIMLPYGEFKDYSDLIKIPFTLGIQSVCPDILHDHSLCSDTKCAIYQSKEIKNIPIINQLELKKIFISLFPPLQI